MTIIRIKKYLFIGVTEDIATFFKRVQQKGLIEFLSPRKKKCSLS